MAAWLLLSFGFYLISRGYAAVEHARLAVVVLALAKVSVAVLLLRSAQDLSRSASSDFARHTPRTMTMWLLVPALLAWFAVSDRFSVATVLAPAYLIAIRLADESMYMDKTGTRAARTQDWATT